MTLNRELLTAALVGYEAQSAELKAKIAEIREQLESPIEVMAKQRRKIHAIAKKGKRKGGMSAEGRARIAAASKKRWAAFRKAKKAAATAEVA